MIYFLHNQKFTTRMMSVYMILMFLCLPIWNVVGDNYKSECNNAIELEKVLELETEDSSKKEISGKYQHNNTIQSSIKKGESNQVMTLYAFKHLNTSFEVFTPPPEFI